MTEIDKIDRKILSILQGDGRIANVELAERIGLSPTSIGERLKRLREDAGLSQRELSDGLDRVSFAFISRIEAGERRPSERTMRQLAGRLGVTALYLETGSDSGRCPHCGRTA